MLGLEKSLLPSIERIIEIHGIDGKGLGIKRATRPLQQLVVLLVRWIRNRLQKLLVTPRTAAVFWWTGTLSTNAGGVLQILLARHDFLELDCVMPIIAEVVHIGC